MVPPVFSTGISPVSQAKSQRETNSGRFSFLPGRANREAGNGVMFEVARQQSRVLLQRYRCKKRISGGQGCARSGKLIAVYPCNACRLLGNLPVDERGK